MKAEHQNLAMRRIAVAVVACVTAVTPVGIAMTVTAPSEPVRFLTRPWMGWRFTGSVVTASIGGHATSPGAALRLAHRAFRQSIPGDATTPIPTFVELVYVPRGEEYRFEAFTRTGDSRVQMHPGHELVWQVVGRYPGSNGQGVVGLIDYSTGDLVWDVRHSGAVHMAHRKARI